MSPFGTICYAHVPSEVRQTLESTVERSRLLGYGDDDDTVTHKGYLLLQQSDHSVFFSRSVRFDVKHPLCPLSGESPLSDDSGGSFLSIRRSVDSSDSDSQSESHSGGDPLSTCELAPAASNDDGSSPISPPDSRVSNSWASSELDPAESSGDGLSTTYFDVLDTDPKMLFLLL